MITNHIELTSPLVTQAYRIALASDLHSKDPAEALSLIRASKPDLICAAGDIFDSTEDDPANGLSFLKGCAQIAPCFYTAGNHEGDRSFLTPHHLADLGVRQLENQSVKLGELWIGGFCEEQREDRSLDFARDFSRKEGFKLLLCHRPELFCKLRGLPIQLVLSGHAHGGQIRLGKRGLFAPGQGLFPRWVSGLYEGRLAVSAGLSNSVRIPRWGNPTELVVIHLLPREEKEKN